MGHRALVAYERTDEQYSVHYSHWGASDLKLKYRISEQTPFGGDDTDSAWAQEVITQLAEGCDAEAVEGYLAETDQPPTLVEPSPLAIGCTLDEIIAEHLDYLHHEAFFVVTPAFEVTAYRTLWFGLQYDCETIGESETIGNGALTTIRWYDGQPVGDGWTRGQFSALKDVAGDLINDGVFTESEAIQYIKQKLAEWVGDRQELLIPTEERPTSGPEAEPS